MDLQTALTGAWVVKVVLEHEVSWHDLYGKSSDFTKCKATFLEIQMLIVRQKDAAKFSIEIIKHRARTAALPDQKHLAARHRTPVVQHHHIN